MLTISKPLSAGQAQAYHKEEFANAQGNYYSEGERIRGEWHGKLAEEWGLRGDVQEEHFARLAEGHACYFPAPAARAISSRLSISRRRLPNDARRMGFCNKTCLASKSWPLESKLPEYPDMKITFTAGRMAATRCINSRPLICGMITSVSMRSIAPSNSPTIDSA
jgi:hypothetical protein